MEKERSKNAAISRRTFVMSLGGSLLGLGFFGIGQTAYESIKIENQVNQVYPPVPQTEWINARETVTTFDNRLEQLAKEAKKEEAQSLIQSTDFNELKQAYENYNGKSLKRIILRAQLSSRKNLTSRFIASGLALLAGHVILFHRAI